MTYIESVTLEAEEPAAARAFYTDALGLDTQIRVGPAREPSTGFRGYTLSLVVAQPATVRGLFDAAVAAGGTAVKPVKKSLWGHSGVLRSPDGALWKIATSAKKDTGPDDRGEDKVVLLLGCDDILAGKRFYVGRGFGVAKSFGRKYVEFAAAEGSPVTLALYQRRALAKDAGVSPEGTGAHRLTIAAGAESFTDPDGFAWQPPAAG